MRIESTEEEKALAFEWLRQQALLPNNPRAFYAGLMLQEIAELKAQLAEEQALGWVSVKDRLPDENMLVLVYTPPLKGEPERFDFDAIVEGGWNEHDNSYEHFIAVGGGAAGGPDCVAVGPSQEAPYTHWRRVDGPGGGDKVA